MKPKLKPTVRKVTNYECTSYPLHQIRTGGERRSRTETRSTYREDSPAVEAFEKALMDDVDFFVPEKQTTKQLVIGVLTSAAALAQAYAIKAFCYGVEKVGAIVYRVGKKL